MKTRGHQIEFNTAKINSCLSHIAEVSNIVTTIFHLSKNQTNNEILPLETDSLSFVFGENGNASVTSEKINEWIFRKAFEDCIIGVTQSLIEAYKFIKISTRSRESSSKPFGSIEQINDLLVQLEATANKLHLPVLIQEIEKEISEELFLKKEILSINQIRNCLVHRNGYVSSQDINDLECKSLILKYIDMKIYIEVEGQIIELTNEIKKQKLLVTQLIVEYPFCTVKFKMGEKLILNADIFKGITWTCIEFTNKLINNLPLPDDVKLKMMNNPSIRLVYE